ncbi:MAG TPA: glycoside hydrolase family 9 protein [Gemmatimonadaceae bacterium]|nr:glycoside hydrolase family 9 protein [Gemmatimonadaceae bacterium]
MEVNSAKPAHFFGLCVSALLAAQGAAQAPAMPMPIDYRNSAEFGWMSKKVLATRTVEPMTAPANWVFQGTGTLSFHPENGATGRPALRVDMDMFTHTPAPTRSRLSSVNLKRPFAGEDWSPYNRLSFWIRPLVSGFPMLPIQIVLHNDGKVRLPDAYYREGIHYVTLQNNKWQQVNWEITPLPRDKVTAIEIGYWVNKMLAQPGDRVAFEIGRIDLQRVEPDHYEGWSVAPGKISFSHTGYPSRASKTAIASGVTARTFRVRRVNAGGATRVVLEKPVKNVATRLGKFQQMDFSAVRAPGRYVIESGGLRTRPFQVSDTVWRGTIWKTINFFFGERCGYAVPGSHGVDHLDWFATLGDQKITMSGGWHDAGDLSQGLINTGEATYAMFALAERLKSGGDNGDLYRRLVEEAKWGLAWVLRVRFDGGYRIGFASHNLWTNNIVGDADDRSREAKNNPNVNYIAAAAEAIAYRVLKDTEPALAARSLATAEDDWRHAIAGKEGPETWHTPAFAATPIELAGIGILASLELYEATRKQQYADKAIELAPIIIASQQKRYVGSRFPLAGFFYTGPDRDTLFHQFHRGNDQVPIVALARLVETFPNHKDWMKWYSTVALYTEYQKAGARATEPYEVLPAYVYDEREYLQVPEKGALHMATREAFREQVLQGMPMGEGYYLKAFPVWFARRGNFGVLLSQAKALSAASRLRRDAPGLELAQKQAEWIVGRNPFVQSTMIGEGYDWAQQYSVSSGDFVGALPVGMQSRGTTDLPYWPSQNMYVYKEVWVHPVSRWLWLMADLEGVASREPRTREPVNFSVTPATTAKGEVTITVRASGAGAHRFAIRAENLAIDRPVRSVLMREGRPSAIRWKARVQSANQPWVAVVIPDDSVQHRREVIEYRD